ncbi:uncharacterized protein LOC34618714 [Cyclospora cayetanensis]|uniref:Uncharacterized protein LOC34618714 n=1 Tax=Cyclospora cayetanensis TaxID=88456 RepID=A0A6P6RUY2_9EIME|nr:uncharacterized protein LOC34618714 [Cyclospora cayetanensis]
MEASRVGGGSRSLGDHSLLQLLHRSHEDLISFAVSSSNTECLLLLPQESQLKGFQINQAFLETHILQGTPYGDCFINLRGQEVERRGDELFTSLGFKATVCASILKEERMFGSGGPFSCLLISVPLLPSPAGRLAEGGVNTGLPSNMPRKIDALEGSSPGLSSFADGTLSFLTATETQHRVDRMWKQIPQGTLAERRVHAEIMHFKATYVLVPGQDGAVAQRMRRLVTACCRLLPPNVMEPKEAERLMERFVWLEVHDRLWPFFLETAEKQQEAIERGLEIFRNDSSAFLEGLGLRRELRGAHPVEAGKELAKMPSMLLPHEKLQQLCLSVEAIHRACSVAVAAAACHDPPSCRRKEPVEVCCEDLVALLVLALAEGAMGPLVASYLHMSVLLLQQSREARYEKEAFYLTALHSALTYLSRIQKRETAKNFRTG